MEHKGMGIFLNIKIICFEILIALCLTKKVIETDDALLYGVQYMYSVDIICISDWLFWEESVTNSYYVHADECVCNNLCEELDMYSVGWDTVFHYRWWWCCIYLRKELQMSGKCGRGPTRHYDVDIDKNRRNGSLWSLFRTQQVRNSDWEWKSAYVDGMNDIANGYLMLSDRSWWISWLFLNI